jgi:hypothetical protein
LVAGVKSMQLKKLKLKFEEFELFLS